jgi:S1-C subfamily serine protease
MRKKIWKHFWIIGVLAAFLLGSVATMPKAIDNKFDWKSVKEVVMESSEVELTAEDIAEQSMPAVVQIAFEYYQGCGVYLTQGTGFFVTDDGYIVTNAHVANGAKWSKMVIVTHDNVRYEDVVVVFSHPDEDLAILKAELDKPYPYLTFGDSEQLRLGERVVAIGHPLGLEYAYTSGVVSSFRHRVEAFTLIQHDAPINPGNSGGPLLNMKGEVVGINALNIGIRGLSAGLGFAIIGNGAKAFSEAVIGLDRFIQAEYERNEKNFEERRNAHVDQPKLDAWNKKRAEEQERRRKEAEERRAQEEAEKENN